jgi:hypothetical protein
MKMIKKISLQQFLPQSEAEIQGLFHLLRGFSLSSCPQHSLKVLLLLNATLLMKYVLNCEEHISIRIIRHHD